MEQAKSHNVLWLCQWGNNLPFELSLEDGKFLIRLARNAVKTYLTTGKTIKSPENSSKRLLERCGVFVTINRFESGHKKLRGCIGYPYPTNPLIIAAKKNGYFGSDSQCLLKDNNKFGNNFRYTNDIGQQYTEGFNTSSDNNSPNKEYCMDHLTGIGVYVWRAYEMQDFTWAEAIQAANDFTYAGFSNWRLADIGEFLAIFDMNDWNNAWGAAYTPWMDPNVRNYGGAFVFGCMDRDGAYLSTRTNGPTIQRSTNAATTYQHSLLIRNFS